MTKGDIVEEIPTPKVIEITAGEDLSKGDVVTLADGNKVDIGGNEYGPFGVTIENITSGAKGKVIIKGVVEVKYSKASGNCSAFDMLIASTTTAGCVTTGTKGTDIFEEYIGIALEAIINGGTGKVLLV
jgi:hypothetical protein